MGVGGDRRCDLVGVGRESITGKGRIMGLGQGRGTQLREVGKVGEG